MYRKLVEIEVWTLKEYTLTSIIVFVLGVLFIIGTFLLGYENSISPFPDTTSNEAFLLTLGFAIGIIWIVIAVVRTFRKAEH